MQPLRVVAVVFLASLAAGFGVGRAVPESTSVAAPPATTTTIPAEPLHVVMAGDSVMAGLVPALEAALEPRGDATVDFVLTPAILRDPSIRFSWSQELERLDPDVVVMFVGSWEDREVEVTDADGGANPPGVSTTLDPANPRWADEYRREVVDPWLDLITSRGARVLWIGAPPVADPARAAFFAKLNEVFSAVPEAWPQVTYLDPSEALGPSGAGFADVVTLPDGTAIRLRQVDGLHLCPSGAQLLAELVVDDVAAAADLAVADRWQDGPWRVNEGLYPVAGCPVPGALASMP